MAPMRPLKAATPSSRSARPIGPPSRTTSDRPHTARETSLMSQIDPENSTYVKSRALISTDGEDPRAVLGALRGALDGGPAIGLGMLGEQPSEVEEGTAAVIATSGSTGIPKRVVL